MSFLSSIKSAYQSWMWWPGDGHLMIDFLYGVLASQTRPGARDPAWAVLVAPGSTGKTEIVRPLFDLPGTYKISSLTPRTLWSGYKDEEGKKTKVKKVTDYETGEEITEDAGEEPPQDYSLILRLKDKFVIISEFTTTLNMPERDLRAVMGQLREAYDGTGDPHYGNQLPRSYRDIKFTIFANSTPQAVDPVLMQDAQFGMRFVLFRIQGASHADRVEQLTRTEDTRENKASLQRTTRDTIVPILDEAKKFLGRREYLPTIHPEFLARLRDAVVLATAVRTLPDASQSYIDPEGASRLYDQTQNIIHGRVLMDERPAWTEDDLALAMKIIRSSVPTPCLNILRCLYEDASGCGVRTEEVRNAARCNPTIFWRFFDQWSYDNLVGRQGKALCMLLPATRKILQSTNLLGD